MAYGLLSSEQSELLNLGLSPEPGQSRIVDIGNTEEGVYPADTPVSDIVSGEVITNWLCKSPIPFMSERVCVRIDRGLRRPEWAEEARSLLEGATLLDPAAVVRESYPDYGDAIDLLRLTDGAQETYSLFLGLLRCDRDRLMRLSHGVAGENVAAQILLNGVSVAHGDVVSLPAGLHSVIMEVYNGTVHYDWQWPERRISPRFDDVTREAIDAHDQWRHDRWQRSLDMARRPEHEAVSEVEIDPESLRGTEGFIRVGQSRNGVYWLTDPEGNPFYYRAMCSVNNSLGPGGRRKGVPQTPEETVTDWLGTMKQWGFNGLGSWTTPEFFDRGMVYTEIIESYYEGPYLQDGPYRHGVVPDVFDPEWARRVEGKCAQVCTPLRDRKELLGYFIDNERNFLDTQVPTGATGSVFKVGEHSEVRREIIAAEPIENAEQIGLLQLVLSIDASRPAAQRAWEFVTAKYGDDIEALAQAWDVPLASRLSINEMTINGERMISDGYLADEKAFLKLWIRKYFEVNVEAIKKYDPNHLIIGLRWAGIPDPLILAEEVKWCDIISLNHYRARMVEIFDPVFQTIQKPILIGECEPTNDSFEWVHDPIEPPGGYASEAERMATRLYECMDRVFAHRGIVGYTFYAWKFATLNYRRMRPVIAANRRATHIHCETDKPRDVAPDVSPLHGQVFLTMVMKDRQTYELGLVCEQGSWDSLVTGNGIRGELKSWRDDGNTITLDVDFKLLLGMFACTEDEVHASMTLTRSSNNLLEGSYRAMLNGAETTGAVKGYLHKPYTNRIV